MKYTEFSNEQEVEYSKKYSDKVSFEDIKRDRGLFAYHCLGMKPYIYQDHVLSDNGKRIVVCTSRQIGKTSMVSWRSLFDCMFNPDFKFMVISRTLEQSKKVIRGIKELMVRGDKQMESKTGMKKFFTSQIDPDRPNNVSVLSFKNGSFIKSLPPTDAARGETADVLYVDEAAYVDDDIYQGVLKPTVLATGGTIILSSTPNGHKGFFFKLFDPSDKLEVHEFSRYWFPWSVCPNPHVRDQVLADKKTMDPLLWTQEYEATFETTASAYFENPDIDKCVDYNIAEAHHWQSTESFMGIDWGYKDCHTVVTIVAPIDKERFRMLYQQEYPSGYDNRLVLEDINRLCRDFNVTNVYSDDCGLAHPYNTEMEEQGVIPLSRFDFNKDKNKAFAHFKDLLFRGLIVLPPIKDLLDQMKSMVFERTANGHLKIHAPQNYYDDRVDSLVMACWQAKQEDEIGLMLV